MQIHSPLYLGNLWPTREINSKDRQEGRQAGRQTDRKNNLGKFRTNEIDKRQKAKSRYENK